MQDKIRVHSVSKTVSLSLSLYRQRQAFVVQYDLRNTKEDKQ